MKMGKKKDGIYTVPGSPDGDVAKILKKRKLKRIIITSIILVIFLFTFVKRLTKKKNKPKSLTVPVQITDVKIGNIEKLIKINGEINAKYAASIFSDVAGRVKAVLRREGSHVSPGTPLFLIDRRSLGVDYLDFVVNSPIGGVVGSVDVELGHTVGTTTQLMQVVNPRYMECVVNIVEKDIGLVKLGQKAYVTVDAYPGIRFNGIVTDVDSVVNTTTRTVKAKIYIDNIKYPANPLKHGMYANANIIVDAKTGVVLIPYSAVLDNRGEKYVYIAVKEANGKYKAVKKDVKLGYIKRVKQEDGDFIDFAQVISGLAAGEKVIFLGQRFLQEGILIEPKDSVGQKLKFGNSASLPDAPGSSGSAAVKNTPRVRARGSIRFPASSVSQAAPATPNNSAARPTGGR
jgi:multidrug efflux pump subunit AcrA (membrane-fusion protein)